MTTHSESVGLISPIETRTVPSGEVQLSHTHSSIMRKMALAVALAVSPVAASACIGADFTVGTGVESDAGTDATADSGKDADAVSDSAPDAETGTDAADAPIDAPADSGKDDAEADSDSGADAETGTDADSGTSCSKSGTVVFDPSMGCYKEGIVRSGSFLPSPESSEDTPVCQSGTCANSPVSGTDTEVLWVQEGSNTGKFSSTKTPAAYSAHCTPYTSLTPPTLTQLAADLTLPTGWFTPAVTNIGTDYKLDAPVCAGSSVLYVIPH
jgi:hypothetical protein